ncbi:MAG TPA: hypothetical protein VH561_03190 [Micromonosporaceae bacterium]
MSVVTFTVDGTAVRRRCSRVLRVGVGYLAVTVAMLGLVALTPAREPVALALFAVGALQLLFWDAQILRVLLRLRRLSRDAGGPSGGLTVDSTGIDDGRGAVPWSAVRTARVYRDAVPRLTVVLRRGTGRRGTGRRLRSYQAVNYATTVDDLAAAFAPHVAVVDRRAPLPPLHDEAAGVDEFSFRLWPIRARRTAYARNALLVAAMLLPPVAGLLVVGQPAAAALLVVLLAGYVVWCLRRAAKAHRELRKLGGGGRGRLRLTADHLLWTGIDVPIEWRHVHDVRVDPDGSGSLVGVFSCRDESHACPYRDKSIAFRTRPETYTTTLDDLIAAFSRHVPVGATDSVPEG